MFASWPVVKVAALTTGELSSPSRLSACSLARHGPASREEPPRLLPRVEAEAEERVSMQPDGRQQRRRHDCLYKGAAAAGDVKADKSLVVRQQNKWILTQVAGAAALEEPMRRIEMQSRSHRRLAHGSRCSSVRCDSRLGFSQSSPADSRPGSSGSYDTSSGHCLT